jgi:hypothetical protein
MNASQVQIERHTPQQCYEVVSTHGTASLDLPLNFAPRRWLLPDPAEDVLVRLGGHSGVVLVDVDGKWQRRVLSGAQLWRVLSAGADVEAMLRDRHCDALTLFDCPIIAARSGEGVELWVLSSYARFLDERLGHLVGGNSP